VDELDDTSPKNVDDSTLRQLAEERRTILDTITIGITHVRARKLRWANEAFAEMFGYEASELPGLETSALYASGEEYARIGHDGYSAIRTNKGYTTESLMKKKDGSQMLCRFSGRALDLARPEDGSIWTLQDITEERRAEKALHEQAAEVAMLMKSMANAFIVWGTRFDADGRLVDISFEYFNDAYSKISSLALADVRGKTVREVWPQTEESWFEVYGEVARTGESKHFEMAHAPTSGIYACTAYRPWASRDRVCCVFENITERLKLQAQLEQAVRLESVGRLAGGVAHDFNNLLTAIIGNLELAQSSLREGDPVFDHIEQAVRASERATSLTRQLLAFSRRQIIEPRIVDLNDLVENVGKILLRLIGEDIRLSFELGRDLASVEVDPGQFEQVLINLAVNARDAMADGGSLHIATSNVELDEHYCALHPEVSPGRYLLLAVSDTGHGMTAETMAHIFEPFFTTKEKGKGTGLGLAMVFGTVKQAGGSIEVYSELGMGSVFKVYLPRAARSKDDVWPPSRVVLGPSSGHETILFVEDSDEVRALGVEILGSLGYSVIEAANGEEAVRVSRTHGGKIDLLFTDVVMPGMNGRKLAETLLESRPETKVLYTSGYTENVIVHHGILEKRLSFIAKPYTRGTLSRKVREVLDS